MNRSLTRGSALAAAALAGWVLAVFGLAGILRWSGARPGPGAQSSLEHSTPSTRGSSGGLLGYTRFTAQELNRIRQGSDLRSIRFVTAGVPSTGPSVVSVNPIDDFTWAAASLSDETGRCYVILEVTDRTNPQLGSTRYGWLPRGAMCTAEAATPESVTRSDWPDQGRNSVSWIEGVLVGVLFWAPLVAALGCAIRALHRNQERGRAAWSWVGSLVLFAIAWWLSAVALLGSLDQSFTAFDLGTFGRSLVWSLLSGLVPVGAALAFFVGKRRDIRGDQILRLIALGVLIPGVPLAFVVIAGSII